jgi:hypothetical protein
MSRVDIIRGPRLIERDCHGNVKRVTSLRFIRARNIGAMNNKVMRRIDAAAVARTRA